MCGGERRTGTKYLTKPDSSERDIPEQTGNSPQVSVRYLADLVEGTEDKRAAAGATNEARLHLPPPHVADGTGELSSRSSMTCASQPAAH